MRGLIVLSALVGSWWVLTLTVGNRWAERAPDLALAWQGNNAIAGARVAAALLEQQDIKAPAAHRAEALARESLRRRALNPIALRALALAYMRKGDAAQGRRLLLLAERSSRRDTPSQILLIEFAVSAGDIAGALRHYDRALLVSRTSSGLLLPVLASASQDPAVRAQLRPILARRPEWLPFFIDELGRQSQIGAPILADLADGIGLKPASAADIRLTQKMIANMVRRKGYAEARALLGVVQGREQVRNGGFEARDVYPPFDWTYPNQGGWTASPGNILSEGTQLALRGNYAAGGIAAQQILSLKPGSYVLSFVSGGDAPGATDTPTISIWCESATRTSLMSVALTADSQPKSQSRAFTVPSAGCAQQWIRVEGPAMSGQQEYWIDKVSVVPSSGNAPAG